MADDVQLTDLEVIQRYSLAVRGATASRAELVQALEADLAWLTGSSRPRRAADPAPDVEPAAATRPARTARTARTATGSAARTAPERTDPAPRAAVKKAAARPTPKRTSRT